MTPRLTFNDMFFYVARLFQFVSDHWKEVKEIVY